MNRIYQILLETLLTGLPLAFQVYRKTGNLTSSTLTLLLTVFLVDRFLLNPVRAWENLALFINPFALSTGGFVTSLVYLNYTGTAFAAAKWQAFGISLLALFLGFMLTRFWST